MNRELAVKSMDDLKLKSWYHIRQFDKSFPEANGYPVSGMMSIWDYQGEEIYSLPDHPFMQRLSKGIGTPLLSYKLLSVNTTVHLFKAPNRNLLITALKIQGAQVKEYMKFDWDS